MRCSSFLHAVIVGALLLVPLDARAEAPTPPPAGKAMPAKAPAAPPAAAARPRAASKAQRRAKSPAAALSPDTPVASYPAFRLLDDGSTRVSVEVSRKVTITEHKAQGRVVYRLDGVAIPGHTTQLPLPTGFFRTPVDRVEMVEQSGGADLVIELREAVQPTYRVLDTPRGIVLQVDFPRPASVEAALPPDGARRTSETRRLEEPRATTTDD
jgi:hypothetical protein